MTRRGVFRLLGGLAALAAAVVLAAAGLATGALRGSLARLDGSRNLPGLAAEAVVERDAAGLPTVSGAGRVDVARALGYLHAQERFFQMDLLRRSSAGELAALIGPAVFERDRDVRRHQLRAAARREVDRLPAAQRTLLDAYVAGVNAGLQDLTVRPPEYLLLRARPEAWRPEDTLLVGWAMYFSLQDSEGREDRQRAAVARALPPEAARFFFPESSEWDAALDDSLLPEAPLPAPEVLDVSRLATAPDPNPADPWEASPLPGSNSWGVEGTVSATGAAIVANDMHLDLGVPNIWFRVCLKWTDPDGRARRAVGVSLPGVPGLIVGSNGDVAWGFTNATLDTTDLFIVEADPSDPGRYRTPDGSRPFETVSEVIAVLGEAPRTVTYTRTIWGPLLDPLPDGRRCALRWLAHLPGALNLQLLEFENARTVADAVAVAARAGIPVQNILAGDRQGRLAWTLCGPLPGRTGYRGDVPVPGASGTARWEEPLPAAARPVLQAPAGGRFWTANNRITGQAGYLTLGAGETDLGARARQIRDDLRALPAPVSEPDLLSIHRDDRALFLARWQALLLEVLGNPAAVAATPHAARWAEIATPVRDWGGRAGVDSVGYRLVRAFRYMVQDRLLEPVVALCRKEDPKVHFRSERQETPAWALLSRRPAHLLNPQFKDYDQLLADAVDGVLKDLDQRSIALTNATWGARNTLRQRHPISQAVPALGRWLDMLPVPLPGDDHMPRVQGAGFGASERLVVSPGHEERGICQMPGGPSGHFLSPFYRSGHDDWVRAQPSPLLPGPTRHRLVLRP